MNVMEPYGGQALSELLIHAGFFLTALAYLFRDILWLRVLAMLANGCILAAALRVSPEPPLAVVSWSGAFILINAAHSAWLIWERHLRRFSGEEAALYAARFDALDKASVRRLMRRGSWRNIAEQECLLRQGVPPEELILIAEGEAGVLVGGRLVSRLAAGSFVGEISFLSGSLTTAMVVATAPLRCLTWRKAELDRLLVRQPELRSVLNAAIGGDLADKIASQNLKLATL